MTLIPAERTWTIGANQTYSANLMDDQYQEGVYEWKALCVAAGWTVVKSSDGIIADDTDNWGSASDIGFGLQGNGAWIVLRSPSGWLTNEGFVEQLFYVDDTSGTPQVAEHKFCTFGYRDGDANGNGVNSLPIANSAETTNFGSNGHNIVPWTADAVVGRFTTWRSTRGDVMMFVKEFDTDSIKHVWMLTSNTDADGEGEGNQRWFMHGVSTSSDNGVFFGPVNSLTAQWKGMMPGGGVIASPEGHSILEAVTFTNSDVADGGKDFAGNTMAAPIGIWTDVGQLGRYYGRWVDALAAPQKAGRTDTTWNEGDAEEIADSQDPKRVLVGSIWVYMPASLFPDPFE